MKTDRPNSAPQNESGAPKSPEEVVALIALDALGEASLPALLNGVVPRVCQLLKTELGAFFESLPERGTVALRGGVGWKPDVARQASLAVSEVMPPESTTGAAEPVVLQDAGTGAGTDRLTLLREHGVVSGLIVRVDRDGALYGMLGVFTRARREFPREEVELLRSIGAVLSAAATRWGREQAIRDSEARLGGIIASAMDAIIAVDEEQRIVLFNHAAENVFRCVASDAIGMPLDRFIPARVRKAHSEHIRRFGTSGATVRRMGRLDPLTGLRADGEEFPIEASISHAEVGGRRVFTVILRDISERRRLETQLLHSQRLESVGRLAGGIAHDFNNMLTAIFGYLDVARGHAPATGLLRECLDAILTATQRAADLTGKLLIFAHKQVNEPTVVDLKELVRGILGMVSRILGEHIEVVVHETPLLPNVRVDASQFEHVLVNLAVNARDAMPKGGKFIVEMSRAELDEEYAQLHPGMEPGTYVLLAVSDTGVGMDPVTLEHCFEPFFTTKGPKRGTGLGLATCHGIVKQNGGHIAVYSERDRGTTFRIFLPACDGPADERVVRTETVARGGTGTILLVEDDALVRGIAVRALREAGYTVLEAADADTAMARATQTSGVIDLLLTDVILPKVSGGELARQLRQLRPELRVLFTSGFTDTMIAEHGVLAAGAAFLAKPYTPSGLAAKIRELLDTARNPSDER